MRGHKGDSLFTRLVHSTPGALILAFIFALIADWLIKRTDLGVGPWLERFGDTFVRSDVWTGLGLTLKRFFAGYLWAVVLGTVLGVVMGRVRAFARVLSIPVNAFRAIPSAAVVPFAMAFLPLAGDEMKVFVVAYGAIWPILLQVAQGSRDVDRLLIDSGRTLGKSNLAVFTSVVLPATLPAAMTGARVGLGIGLLLAVTAEILTPSDGGLGFMILDFERAFSYPEMCATVIVLAVVGIVLDHAFKRLEYKLVGWHHGHR